MSLIFSSQIQQREYLKTSLHRWYPSFQTGGAMYAELLKKYLTKESTVLDAGCGMRGILADHKNLAAKIVGVDQSEFLLSQNNFVAEKILTDLSHIPLSDASIDVVTSEFVLEHLKEPLKVFQELFRLLRPGGFFLFITPNVYNPVMSASKILPHFIHAFLTKKLLHHPEEAHETWYRANSIHSLMHLGNGVGFTNMNIERAGNPEYLAFAKPLVIPSVLFERLLSYHPFTVFQMYLTGAFQKPMV
jgi:ubiquinone/menaquinone biosynthesis C-methylase UbiE